MKIFVVFLLTSISFFLYSQAPSIQWQNRFGGNASNGSYFSSESNNGKFIIGGRSNSNISYDKTENSRGNLDYWIVKTDANGQLEWDKTIGGGSPNGWEQDTFYSTVYLLDGNYLIGGTSSSPISGDKTIDTYGGGDYWIVKISNANQILWQKGYGGLGNDTCTTIISTIDGGFLLGGTSNSEISGTKSESCRGSMDYWVVKIDSYGNILWDKTFGGNSNDSLNSLIQTNDGGYLLGGSSNSNSSFEKTEDSRGLMDFWIMKLNSNGIIEWQRTIGGEGNDSLYKVIQTYDGGYFIAGYSNSNASGEKIENSRGLTDYWVLKLNEIGVVEWQKTIGGDSNDFLYSAATCNDAGFIIAGSSSSSVSGDKTLINYGGSDAWILKLSNIGEILWQKVIGGILDEGINCIFQTSDDGYFLSGITSSPISNDITIAPKGIYDYWVVKLSPENMNTVSDRLEDDIMIYPNPTNGEINIKFNNFQETILVKIQNVFGQILFEKVVNKTQFFSTKINTEEGVYFLTLENNKNHLKKSFKILKKS